MLMFKYDILMSSTFVYFLHAWRILICLEEMSLFLLLFRAAEYLQAALDI